MKKDKFKFYTIPLAFNGLGLNMNEKALLSIYVYYTYYGYNGCCTMSLEHISNIMEVDERTVRRCRENLEKKGFINVKKGNVVEFIGIKKLEYDDKEIKKIILGNDKMSNSKLDKMSNKTGQNVQPKLDKMSNKYNITITS